MVAAAAFAPRWAPPLTRPPHPPASWYLEVEMETLFDACEEHLKENGLPEDTKFWCCFYSFRQNHITEDLPYLSACVAQVRQVNIGTETADPLQESSTRLVNAPLA